MAPSHWQTDRMRRPGIPLFFKLWFAFVGSVAIAIIGTSIYLTVRVLTDPAVLGRAAGEIMRGYNETKE